MSANGLSSFAFHADDAPLSITRMGARAASHGIAAPDLSTSSPQDAARHYLQESLASPDLPAFTIAPTTAPDVDFEVEATEDIPLTKSRIVRFRQHVKQVPVYGSVVAIELDRNNGLLSLNSALGAPEDVDVEPGITPEQAIEAIAREAGLDALPNDTTPSLRLYYDPAKSTWRLVYIAEDVVSAEELEAPAEGGSPAHSHPALPPIYDFVLDAHSGDLVAKLPRVATAAAGTAAPVARQVAVDELGIEREIGVLALDGGGFRAYDPELNLHTHDVGFRDVRFIGALPGDYSVNPPDWSPAAVSAHANAAAVARFVREVLMRDGIDNRGGRYVSSINCLFGSAPNNVWRNAAWYRGQMIYGQRLQSGTLISYSAALDVVAHEIFHGITDATARLQYQGETGALNESYSDIFGIIVSNLTEPNFDNWNWEMGEDLSETGIPIRDFSNPRAHDQPDHMDDFVVIEPPFTRFNDYGGVHINSGIHNRAAFTLMTSRDAGAFIFTPGQIGQLFYLGLLALGPTSLFTDSRRAGANAGRTLFRNDAARNVKLAAIDAAFDAAGILGVGV